MIKALVVDDEPKARESLCEIIRTLFPSINLIGEANGVEDAFSKIVTLDPNVVFLDIKMPDCSGFDLLKRFQKVTFKTVFVTAYSDYALDAFRYSAFDYLLKPINTIELRAVIEKLTTSINEEENITTQMKAFFENIDSTNKNKKIVLKTSESIHLVSVSNIIRCEADCNYTWFHFSNQPKLIISKPLKQYEEMLEPLGFMRVHQSHLVNLSHLVRIDKIDGGTIVLTDNKPIPISVRKRDQVFKFLEKM